MFGIKVSKQGYDAKSTTDDKLVTNSQYPHLKIFMEGTGSLEFNIGDTSKTATHTHNLGYAPMWHIVIQRYDPADWTNGLGEDWVTIPYATMSYGASNADFGIYRAVSDDNDLLITVSYNTPVPAAATLNYRYKIYVDPQ